MALPDWINAFKEPKTCIKCISGHYYKYAVSYIYDPKTKRSKKKYGKILGKITQDKGFIPSSKTSLKESLETLKVDIKTFGDFALFEELLREEINILKDVLGTDLAEKISVFALMRLVHQSPIKRIAYYHSHNFCSQFWSSDKVLTDKVVSEMLKKIGENRQKVMQVLRKFLPKSSESFILIDSTHIITSSENIKINAKGYNPNFDFDKQIRLMYCFSTELNQPVYYRLLNGNVSDLNSMSSCVQELNVSNVVFVADKGFYSENNIKVLQSNNLQFIIPLKRNHFSIDYSPIETGNLKKTCQFFQYQKRIIWYYMYENSQQKFITFLSPTLQTEEENDYLRRMLENPEEYTHDEYLRKLRTFSTLTIAYNVCNDFSAQQIYEIYKKRNEIEVMFDCYKNFMDADTTYMHDRYVLEGWMFGNFLAMIAYYKLFERLRAKGMLSKYSPKDIMEISQSIHQICINGNWSLAPTSKKNMALLEKLQLLPLSVSCLKG
jgi:hypothetical protein